MKIKNKVLFIDVGSHECQEIKSLTEPSIILTLLFLKRYIINWFIDGKIVPSLGDFFNFLNIRRKILSKIDFSFVSIEPNWRHFDSKIYKKLNYVFCFGLQKMDVDIKIKPLSYKISEKKCQGATLFEESSNPDLADLIPVLDTDYFCANILQPIVKQYNNDISFKIILRLNCEGTEDEVIYSINKKFSKQLVGILGSLDDVRKKKGNTEAEALEKYLHLNSIDFCRFSSNINTWPETIRFLYNKLL
ncbi:hypothetical protein N8992_01890 [Candidatus Pelagibacter ubique]|nr:hypothetical protein [Candidatus Pelagibacter ubique]